MIQAIVLAAGRSQRMGYPKPLVRIGCATFLEHVLGQIRATEIKQPLVVLGHRAGEIEQQSGTGVRGAGSRGEGLRFVINSEYDKGQFSSLQCGIRNLESACEAVVVCLVDQPQIRDAWINRLLAGFRKSGAPIVRPRYRGRGGHPVLYARSLFEEILDMEATLSARDLLGRHREEVEEIEIDDEAILFNANRPEDLKRLMAYIDL